MDAIQKLLSIIYDNTKYAGKWHKFYDAYREKWEEMATGHTLNNKGSVFDEKLAIVISYGDSLLQDGQAPLSTLYNFLCDYGKGKVTGLHILPFFPYTSDDGFSISHYRQVRSDLGSWDDIHKISSSFCFMTDLVLNHCSSEHEWFKKFLQEEKPYTEFFILADPQKNYSMVTRPRPHFILSTYDTKLGQKHVWTTFSRDQVDLNFENPQVLFEMLDTILEYAIVHSSRFIRLDAIAYLWKEYGTSCVHHPKTHLVVKLMRKLLDMYAFGTVIITETNVPHKENISYFGNNDEAQMIYQFSLPPLLLHAFVRGDAQYLSSWAKTLDDPQENRTYFNFCASHDGIGVTPTYGLLPPAELDFLINTVKKRGARISYKATDKGEIPYEININYLSAVADAKLSVEERATMFLATQFVLLAMPGVPGIYIHSILGSENWEEGVVQSGVNRSINREKLNINHVRDQLEAPQSLRSRVLRGYLALLEMRQKSKAFHPFSPMKVIDTGTNVFAIVRGPYNDNPDEVLCLVNVSNKECVQKISISSFIWKEGCVDLITGDIMYAPKGKNEDEGMFSLSPYEIICIKNNCRTVESM